MGNLLKRIWASAPVWAWIVMIVGVIVLIVGLIISGNRTSSGGSDPWAGVNQTIVAKAASDSMDAIAGFLTTAPVAEAKPNAREATRTAQAAPAKRR